MLDTIRLRLYGILDTKGDTLSVIQRENGLSNYVAPEHNDLYLKILEHKGKNFSLTVIFNKEKNVWENVTNQEFVQAEASTHHMHQRQMIRFVDEEKQKEINMRIHGTYRVPSSFSDVTFSVNENGSFIDFEFSIPKYLYGHSLAEFIPQQGSDLKFRDGVALINFQQQAKYLHKRMKTVVDTFFNDLCRFFKVDTFPNQAYVEIRRLDLCYNQYFKSKDEAFMYLGEQKKINAKRQQKNSNISKNYDTSISYHTAEGSYFKIYHKGSEYSKSDGDLKKHLEVNQEYIDELTKDMNNRHKEIYQKNKKIIWGKLRSVGEGTSENFVIPDDVKERIRPTVEKMYNHLPYKIDFLKKEMDKVLRYEISLKSSYLTNIYKRKVFRTGSKKYNVKGCPHHFAAVQTFKNVKSSLDSRLRKDRKVSPKDLALHKDMNDWYNRSVSLMLGGSKSLEKFERSGGTNYNESTDTYKVGRYMYKHTVLSGKDVGHFSDFFLRKCVDYFQEFIDYYQIKVMQPYDTVLKSMHEYNRQAEVNVDDYNILNEHKIRTWDGKPKCKPNGQRITKATQLLKRSELIEKDMKKVNTTTMAVFLDKLEKGMSLDQIFTKLKTTASSRSRIKKDLEIFGVFRQSLNSQINIEVRTDFFQYYWNTDSELYRAKFYTKQKQFNYGQYNIVPSYARAEEFA